MTARWFMPCCCEHDARRTRFRLNKLLLFDVGGDGLNAGKAGDSKRCALVAASAQPQRYGTAIVTAVPG
jgi:hypothetical protein